MKEKISWLANGGGFVFTIIQTNQIFQLISLILTCIAVALSITISTYNLIKKAKEGKLEVEDLKKSKEEIEKLKEEIDRLKGDNDNEE